ncbi:o-succinylbenzoate--CoA ligase [Sporosarcina sp. OR05]|uniref:o-succinylbenzoate--CoA ligase n=1 Tax=Sporosarcina sp. OR05 TaxID=2969819 RepID=UPI00352AFF85
MIPNWLVQRANLTPNRIALSFDKKEWTFRQLLDEATNIAQKLRTNGLQDGQRIALLGSSTPDMVLMIHGCLLAGLEIVMLNARLTSSELKWQLADSEAVALLLDDQSSFQFTNLSKPILSFSDIHASGKSELSIVDRWMPSKTLTIMYTSGTTGFPKGVRQTAENHTSSALSSVLNLGLTEHDCWLCTMPLFHISGFSILARSVIYGMTVRLYEKFDEYAVADEIQRGQVTRMSVVAASLQRLLMVMEEQNLYASTAFLTMLAGGGPIPVDYLRRARERRLPVLQTYGMTETSSQTATLSAEDALSKIGSAGKPLFFNQIKIDVSANDAVGEVLVAGPHVTPGYIGHAAAVSPTTDGWFPTGDIGYVDEDGYLFIVDRRSDLIISGGENIYPAEIENILASHPLVVEAGVCGQEDEKWGSVPVAFIVSKGKIVESDLVAYCKQHLAGYKVPKAFHFVEQLPRNASNKLVRRKLKEWL